MKLKGKKRTRVGMKLKGKKRTRVAKRRLKKKAGEKESGSDTASQARKETEPGTSNGLLGSMTEV